MENIDFKQLRRLWNLKLVIETGSVKKAAVHANVTSSAVSQSITSLEAELGRKLLFRKKEQILPTEFGLQVVSLAAAAFESFFEMQKNVFTSCITAPKLAWLDFAACESLAVDVLPGIIQRLRKRFPEIRLKVKSGRSAALTQMVGKGELCMALVEDNDFIKGVTVHTIGTDQLGFFCSPQAKAAYANRPQDLFKHLGLGVLAPGPEGHPSHFTRLMKPIDKTLRPVLASESYELLRTAAAEGAVVAVLPARVAARRPGDLVEVFPSEQNQKNLASFKIHLVSEVGCTAQENALLAKELQEILNSSIKN